MNRLICSVLLTLSFNLLADPLWVAVDKSKDGSDLLFRNGTLVNQGDFIVGVFVLSNNRDHPLLIGVNPMYCSLGKGTIEAADDHGSAFSEHWSTDGPHLFDRIAVLLCQTGSSLPIQSPVSEPSDPEQKTST